ncbi:MAG: fatty acyl-AMP ligase [Acidobacteriota bacterium]
MTSSSVSHGRDTLVDILERRARTQAEALSFTFLPDGEEPDGELSFEALARQARAVAAQLAQHARPGARALLLFPSGLPLIWTFFACLYARIVAIPVYPPTRAQKLDRIRPILRDAQAELVLTTGSLLDRLDGDLRPPGAEVRELVPARWLATDRPDPSAGDTSPAILPRPSDQAFLQYTSGSTSAPRGVMVSHGNLVHNSAAMKRRWGTDEASRGVYWLPHFHDMGLIGVILQGVFSGFPTALMPPVAFLQRPGRWLRAISRFRATISGAPNFAYEACVDRVDDGQCEGLDLSCWQVAFNGSEPVRRSTLERFSERFAAYGFGSRTPYPAYGLAESTLMVTGGDRHAAPIYRTVSSSGLAARRVEAPLSADDARDVVGCGTVIEHSRLLIVDPDTLVPCADQRVGEIWVGGPSVTAGYLNHQATNEQQFRAVTADGRGPFLRTGDLGFLVAGELFIVGRCKDVIIVNGANFYPNDLIFAIGRALPELRAVSGAAFAVDRGEREAPVVVHEVPRGHLHGDLGALRSAIRRLISREFELRLADVVLLKPGRVPKTTSGKVQHRRCRDLYLGGRLEGVLADEQIRPDGQTSMQNCIAFTRSRDGQRT